MDEVSIAKEMGRVNADIAHIKNDLSEINFKIDKLVSLEARMSKIETKLFDTVDSVKKLEEGQSKVVWFVIAAVIGAILKIIILDRGGK